MFVYSYLEYLSAYCVPGIMPWSKWFGSEKCVDHDHACMLSPWTVAHQAPLPMGFSRQEYWSGLPFSPSGNLSDPGFEPKSPTSPALAGGIFTTEPPGSPVQLVYSFSFARSLNSRDWLYNTVPTLNNTVLCTWNYINWIDVMLRFLLSPFHQHTQELN